MEFSYVEADIHGFNQYFPYLVKRVIEIIFHFCVSKSVFKMKSIAYFIGVPNKMKHTKINGLGSSVVRIACLFTRGREYRVSSGPTKVLSEMRGFRL